MFFPIRIFYGRQLPETHQPFLEKLWPSGSLRIHLIDLNEVYFLIRVFLDGGVDTFGTTGSHRLLKKSEKA